MTMSGVAKVARWSVLAVAMSASLQGCPLILLGGAVGGAAMVADDRRTIGTQADDRDIQIRAYSQLQGDLPNTAHVDIAVYNRRVLIVGEVPDEAAKIFATKIARNVSNVRGIVNELSVGEASSMTTRSSDTYITSKVKASLVAEKGVPANFFKVVTERGIVYLMGLVTVDEGNRAADIASRVPGVMQVVKVFEYIRAEDAKPLASNSSAASTPTTVAAAPAQADTGATVGAVPDASVSAQPLAQQAPAPIQNAAPVEPGNPKARK
ncbi:BON domain-containing protein [Chitinasiproducens palmae]|uniref:Osmotically-inducible protein OsmY, contains BON domain n=1 Tax=Chitinasiproducens palmae TaxID=1770053 RepID=A0A1H2PPL6_9BURK|nr:BON domain-containing protein [Chitinasiproducens palmae]SDV48623.1 Osmotically-inducible protein OsmY, contains BON domain [Chitinasiproducens palmae]